LRTWRLRLSLWTALSFWEFIFASGISRRW